MLDEKRNPQPTVDKVIALIDWCQQDKFWAPNIQSMAKFREKYDAIRMKALNEYEQGRRNGGMGGGYRPYRNPTSDDAYADWKPNG